MEMLEEDHLAARKSCATMRVLFGAGEEVASLDAVLAGTLTPAAALAYHVAAWV